MKFKNNLGRHLVTNIEVLRTEFALQLSDIMQLILVVCHF